MREGKEEGGGEGGTEGGEEGREGREGGKGGREGGREGREREGGKEGVADIFVYYRFPSRDVVGLKSPGCRRLKRGNTASLRASTRLHCKD